MNSVPNRSVRHPIRKPRSGTTAEYPTAYNKIASDAYALFIRPMHNCRRRPHRTRSRAAQPKVGNLGSRLASSRTAARVRVSQCAAQANEVDESDC